MKNFILRFDEWLSKKLYNTFNFRLLFLLIEWSVHGIPWLIGFYFFLFLFNIIFISVNSMHNFVNLL